jgi:hypothetical protein
MVRYPFDLLGAVSEVEPLTLIGRRVRPEVPVLRSRATEEDGSKDERRVTALCIQVVGQAVRPDFSALVY